MKPLREAEDREPKLSHQVYDRIFERIVSGEYAESSRLPSESDLSRRFGASRPIVREALARLRDDGLIVSRQGSGSYVQRRPDAAVLRFVPGRVGRRYSAMLRVPGRARGGGCGARGGTLGGRGPVRDQSRSVGPRELHPRGSPRGRGGCPLSPRDRAGDPQPVSYVGAALARAARRLRDESRPQSVAPAASRAPAHRSARARDHSRGDRGAGRHPGSQCHGSACRERPSPRLRGNRNRTTDAHPAAPAAVADHSEG